MFAYERAIRFEDVDAARIVFFPRFFGYCHEAMEALFGGIEGGYVGMINDRHIGLPTVHVSSDFKSPLRYGDVARIEVRVSKIGKSSCRFSYAVYREKDGVLAATVEQTSVLTDLGFENAPKENTIRPIAIPDDIRALLTKHLVV
jgi:4-hydroxybenzoyl-CoA thioesterase